jgi:putative flippase GtrA
MIRQAADFARIREMISLALFRKAVSFALIGVVNTSVDAAIFFLALNFLTSSLVAANVLGWIIAASGSYVMNSFITFAAESQRQLKFRSYGAFLVSGLVGLTANTAALLIAAQFLPVWGAKVIALGVAFLINFSLSNFVVFRRRPQSGNVG